MTEVLVALIEHVNNLPILVLLLVSAGLAWTNITGKKEERLERREFQKLIADNTQAIADLRNLITMLLASHGQAGMIPIDRTNYREDNYRNDRYESDDEPRPTVRYRGRYDGGRG